MGEEGSGIKIFCRIRPTKRPSGYFFLNDEHKQLEFSMPSDADREVVHNARLHSTTQKFKFNGIFDMDSSQDDVFDLVARDAVNNALDGYNATIFAYGQTGSGKTFTITGGAERYADRGIIPRALSAIFSAFKDRNDVTYQAYISYLELYNEQGYDLLDPSHESKTLEELPRVQLMEDEDGNIHLRNLSMHLAGSEEEALNLLFLGDTNRAIAETPMNMASSRSHCIFTVSLESRQEGSSLIRRSKLHLVDLAGSERVHKTHSSGQLFREASHINKSLHFLEMVIVALQEARKGIRTHIPYRNSMMTSVLRDSLGGNCKTTMIATINPEPEHTDESISTCRFAQRVARVQNSAIVNEETDPSVLIRQLKSKVGQLQTELAYVKGEAGEGTELSEEEYADVKATVAAWLATPLDGPQLDLGKLTLHRIHAGFRALKECALEGKGGGGGSGEHSGAGGSAAAAGEGKGKEDSEGGAAPGGGHLTAVGPDQEVVEAGIVAGLRDELKRMRAQLTQRDNEIAILVNMVKASKAAAAAAAAGGGGVDAASAGALPAPTPAAAPRPAGLLPPTGAPPVHLGGGATPAAAAAAAPVPAHPGAARLPTPPATGPSSVGFMLASGEQVSLDVLNDPVRALEAFKASYPKTSAAEDNKRLLKEKYDEAKTLADRVNDARNATNRLKAEIEKRRVERAMATLVERGGGGGGKEGDAEDGEADEVEARLRSEMDAHKAAYKESFQRLRDLKADIERIQRVLDVNKAKMQADFESWRANCLMRLGGSGDASTVVSSTFTADATALNASALSVYSAASGASAGAPAARAAASGGSGGGGLLPGQVAPPALRPSSSGGPPIMTGIAEADEDIKAFYRAKEELLRRTRTSEGFASLLADASKLSAAMGGGAGAPK